MIRLSLIVPTYNRADYIGKALRSFIKQDLDPSIYEILVIDNNSTDHTNKVVGQTMKEASCRWRCLKELQQGLHFARNRGIREAQGDIVVFGDDDITASTSWLSNILTEFDCHPTTGNVGGKILPIWNRMPDAWIYDYGTPENHSLFAYLDYGDERLLLEREYVYGCNIAFRRHLAIQVGGSYPDTFPRRYKHLSGTGESAMTDNVRELGYNVVYLPNAVVYHHADSSRITLDYFIDRFERWAVEEVFHVFRNHSKKEAVMHLMLTAYDRLAECGKESQGKINPGYYRIIQRHWAHQMIKQTCRVLSDPLLYEHIVKESYM